MIFNETIAAVSTAPGKGAISVIRICGQDAITIADKLFRGKIKIADMPSSVVRYGKIIDTENNEIIDSVLITVFRSPNSYTGLDTVEISCHGGNLNAALIIELILKNGARYAEPGEFTKLAFLNGKMDLTQVEAVADIINSKTRLAHRSSVYQLSGNLSNELKQIKQSLINIASLLELDIDFGEEQMLNIESDNIANEIRDSMIRIEKLTASYSHGHLLRDGAKIAITGKPNVGKSSLLNALLKKDRAIVSEVPGTTRDYLEESIDIGGIPFILTDTAGIRRSDDPVEKRGIDIARQQIHNADLVLLILDASAPHDQDDEETLRTIQESIRPETGRNVLENKMSENKTLIVKNKIDIGKNIQDDFAKRLNCEEIYISAKNNEGIGLLKEKIREIFTNKIEMESILLTNTRHKNLLDRCLENLQNALDSTNKNLSFEFIAMDIRNAIESIGEITGEITREDILNNIFSNFCIGK